MFDKISIIYNVHIDGAKELAQEVLQEIEKYQKTVVLQQLLPEKTTKTEDFVKDIDLGIVIGGDGTLISLARFYALYDVPVIGINLGRLGFLAQINKKEIKTAIEALFSGAFSTKERLMLQCSDRQNNFSYNALNDVVIKGGGLSRTEKLYLYINGELVTDYLADGLIISTPTGSTAYTLSAGGPIVHPSLDVMTIVPICPHCFGSRALVVPPDEKIEVKLGGDMFLTADGQKNIRLKKNQVIQVIKNPKKAKMLFIHEANKTFYTILKEKFNWGVKSNNYA